MPVLQCDVPPELRLAVKRYALDHDITMRDAMVLALQRLTSCAASDAVPELPQAPAVAPETGAAPASDTSASKVATSVAPLTGASFDEA